MLASARLSEFVLAVVSAATASVARLISSVAAGNVVVSTVTAGLVPSVDVEVSTDGEEVGREVTGERVGDSVDGGAVILRSMVT